MKVTTTNEPKESTRLQMIAFYITCVVIVMGLIFMSLYGFHLIANDLITNLD